MRSVAILLEMLFMSSKVSNTTMKKFIEYIIESFILA